MLSAGVLLGEAAVFVAFAIEPDLGLIALSIHAVTFLACVTGPLWTGDGDDVPVAQFFALSLLPLLRLVFVGFPTPSTAGILQVAVLYAVVTPAVLLVATLDSSPTFDPGWYPLALLGPLAVPIALLVGAAEFLALRPPNPLPSAQPGWLLVGALVYVGLVAPIQEVTFRGLLAGPLEPIFGERSAIALTSVLYGALHVHHGSLPVVFLATVLGAGLGFLYVRTRSLALVTVVNGAAGFCAFVALPALSPV